MPLPFPPCRRRGESAQPLPTPPAPACLGSRSPRKPANASPPHRRAGAPDALPFARSLRARSGEFYVAQQVVRQHERFIATAAAGVGHADQRREFTGGRHFEGSDVACASEPTASAGVCTFVQFPEWPSYLASGRTLDAVPNGTVHEGLRPPLTTRARPASTARAVSAMFFAARAGRGVVLAGARDSTAPGAAFASGRSFHFRRGRPGFSQSVCTARVALTAPHGYGRPH
jgi:hypothetical protein